MVGHPDGDESAVSGDREALRMPNVILPSIGHEYAEGLERLSGFESLDLLRGHTSILADGTRVVKRDAAQMLWTLHIP